MVFEAFQLILILYSSLKLYLSEELNPPNCLPIQEAFAGRMMYDYNALLTNIQI